MRTAIANPLRAHRLQAFCTAGILLSAGLIGCQEPQRPAFTYPAGTLPVRYEPATSHTTCLVASIAMASNYLLGERRFTEKGIQEDLKKQGRDETKIEDLKAYLSLNKLYLITLSGRLDGKPPASLQYWLIQRGYPVVCVINRKGDDPAYNHAVVVTGIEHKNPDVSVDKILYLDPSTGQPLLKSDLEEFDGLWSRAGHAMMIVVAPPAETQPAPSGPKEKP